VEFKLDLYIKARRERHLITPKAQNSGNIHSQIMRGSYILTIRNFGIEPDVKFIIHFVDYLYCYKDAELTLLSGLTSETVNNTALLLIDLISRIMCLFGQIVARPMILK
jgi:hypothetical protein